MPNGKQSKAKQPAKSGRAQPKRKAAAKPANGVQRSAPRGRTGPVHLLPHSTMLATQPAPDSRRSVPMKLLARSVFPAVASGDHGSAVITSGLFERSWIWRRNSSAVGGDTPTYAYVKPEGWPSGAATDNVYGRYVSRALSISSNIPNLYETGFVYILITPGGYIAPSDNDALDTYRSFIVGHKRAARFSLKKLRGGAVDLTVPILSRLAYQKWQNSWRADGVPSENIADDPFQTVHIAFVGLPPYSSSACNFEVSMHEKLEFIHPADSSTQMHHARHSPAMEPGVIHKALEWIGSGIDSAEAAVAHASATIPAISAAAGALAARAGQVSRFVQANPAIRMIEL